MPFYDYLLPGRTRALEARRESARRDVKIRALESARRDVKIRALESALSSLGAFSSADPTKKKRISYPQVITDSRHLAEFDFLGGALIDLIVDHALGEGVTVSTKSNELSELWNNWFTGPQNNMQAKQKEYYAQYLIDGSLPLARVFNDKGPHYAWIDPASIKDTAADPLDGVSVGAIEIEKGHIPEWLLVIKQVIAGSPREEFVGKLNAKRKKEQDIVIQSDVNTGQGKRVGDVFYFKHGYLMSPRGVPLLHRAFDFLLDTQVGEVKRRGLATMLFNQLQLRVLSNQFFAEYSTSGSIATAAENLRDNMVFAGAGRIHIKSNDDQGLEYKAPKLDSYQVGQDIMNVVRAVSLSVGIPAFWLNWTDGVNRALSETAADPAIKRLKSYQNEAIAIYAELFEDFLDEEESTGKLAPSERDVGYTITGPDISAKDVSKMTSSLFQTIQSFAQDVLKDIPQDQRNDLIAQRLRDLSVDYDPSDRVEPNPADQLIVDMVNASDGSES